MQSIECRASSWYKRESSQFPHRRYVAPVKLTLVVVRSMMKLRRRARVTFSLWWVSNNNQCSNQLSRGNWSPAIRKQTTHPITRNLRSTRTLVHRKARDIQFWNRRQKHLPENCRQLIHRRQFLYPLYYYFLRQMMVYGSQKYDTASA